MKHAQNNDDLHLEQDYQRRRVRVREPKKISNVLSQLLAQRGYARVQAAAQFDQAWCSAAGERYASQTRCGTVRRGVLEVFAANSAVVQELSFMKAGLLQKLASLVPEQKIKDLKFKVGTF